MIKIIKASKVNGKIWLEMSKLFVDSFYDYFKSFCQNREKLYKCFKNIFNYKNFYVVLLDKELIGIGACCDGKSSIKIKKSNLYFNLGLSKGKRAYNYFKLIFEDRDYSFEMDKECGMIEFVAVKEKYRNKKIGFTLINHMMCDNKYKRYLSKVGDNNYSGRKVLENIGFEEFDIEQSKIKEKEDVGVENYFYMICENKLLDK